VFANTQASRKVWLAADANGHPLAALSRLDAVRALAEHATLISINLPTGARAGSVQGVVDLHGLLRRAYQLARTLPDAIILCAGKKQDRLEFLVLDRSGAHAAKCLTENRYLLCGRLHRAWIAARTRLERRGLSGGADASTESS